MPDLTLMRQTAPTPDDDDDLPDASRIRQGARCALDRAYRECVEGQPRARWLATLLRSWATLLSVPLVVILRKHPGGTLELEASSGETLLWAELMRIPERWDGGLAGQGPGARALDGGVPVSIPVSDDGFVPWREAARRDRVVRVGAWPLEGLDAARVLLIGHSGAADATPLHVAEAALAAGIERLLNADTRLARQATLAAALEAAETASFVTDVEGTIEWCNAAFTRLTGYGIDEVRGRNPRMLSSGRYGEHRYRALWDALRAGRSWSAETVNRDREGASFTALQTLTPFGVEGRVSHFLAQYQDITAARAQQDARDRQADVDPLSGLRYPAAWEAAVGAALQEGESLCLAQLRLDVCTTDAVGRWIAERLGGQMATVLNPQQYRLWLDADPAVAERMLADLRAHLDASATGAAFDVSVVRAPQDGAALAPLLRTLDDRMPRAPRRAARRGARAMP